MRSLVQEAANIEKAIAQAWRKAGNPTQFEVKVLEEPERNFLGMVTRSAKVAIMFAEGAQAQREQKQKQEPQRRKEQQPAKKQQQQTQQERGTKEQGDAAQKKQRGQQKQESQQRKERSRDTGQQQQQQQDQRKQQQEKQDDQAEQKQQQQSKQRKPQSLWTQERVQHTSNWLREVLDKMGYHNISFTVEPQNLYLRIELSDHLLTQKDREKQLLASLASLMMATMQQQYKKAFRGHKVVLTHP